MPRKHQLDKVPIPYLKLGIIAYPGQIPAAVLHELYAGTRCKAAKVDVDYGGSISVAGVPDFS